MAVLAIVHPHCGIIVYANGFDIPCFILHLDGYDMNDLFSSRIAHYMPISRLNSNSQCLFLLIRDNMNYAIRYIAYVGHTIENEKMQQSGFKMILI